MTGPRLLIGIAGLARSGKDTVADHLRDRHGFSVFSFAKPIKAGLCAMLDLDPGRFGGVEKEEVIPWLGVSPRHLMQTLGTEWGRDLVDPDIWLEVMGMKLGRAGVEHAVISDVRFKNEADWIRAQGGVMLHMRRPSAAPVRAHRSEGGINCCLNTDLLVGNDGTLAELYVRVDVMLKVILMSMGPRP